MGRSFEHARRALGLGALGALLAVALVMVPLALRTDHSTPASAPMPTLVQDPAEPKTVFVGDGSTAGAGASKASERWTSLVSRTLGWDESNLARAGSGFGAARTATCEAKQSCSLSSMVDEIAAEQPKVVVVASDERTFDPTDPKDAAEVLAFFRALRQALPDSTIIAVGPWSAQKEPSSSAVALDKSVESAARAVRGVYVSLLSPNAVDRDMTTRNALVLNDVGHQAVADRVIGTLDDSGN